VLEASWVILSAPTAGLIKSPVAGAGSGRGHTPRKAGDSRLSQRSLADERLVGSGLIKRSLSPPRQHNLHEILPSVAALPHLFRKPSRAMPVLGHLVGLILTATRNQSSD
jgi:hypothetical protein